MTQKEIEGDVDRRRCSVVLHRSNAWPIKEDDAIKLEIDN